MSPSLILTPSINIDLCRSRLSGISIAMLPVRLSLSLVTYSTNPIKFHVPSYTWAFLENAVVASRLSTEMKV